jgi:hypothetical protein
MSFSLQIVATARECHLAMSLGEELQSSGIQVVSLSGLVNAI